MRLNWFSPPLSSKCEAARLSAWLLPELHEHADVVVCSITEEPRWEEINRGDATIYNLAVLPAFAERHPGIVIVHEGSEVPRRALATIVHSREVFEREKRWARRPAVLVLREAATPERYVEAVLGLAAEAEVLAGLQAGQDLTRRAAAEMGAWMAAVPIQATLTQVAGEVQALSGR
jgi:hypothetical protein